MGIIEAIKNGFSLSGKLLKVILFFFALNLIMGLVSLPLANPESAGQPNIAAISFALSIVFFIIFIFLQGGALGLVKDLVKSGNVNMANFTAYGKKYYVRILGILLIYIAIAVVIVLVLSLIGSGILAVADNILTRTIIGAISLIVALMAIVLLLFPIYSVVADENGVITALKKGMKTGWENFSKTLGIFVLLAVISIVISLVVGFIIGLVTIPLPVGVTQIIITIVNSAVQSYLPIVMMIALMGYYLALTKKDPGPEGAPSA